MKQDYLQSICLWGKTCRLNVVTLSDILSKNKIIYLPTINW